jgi:molybdate transport system permease protein
MCGDEHRRPNAESPARKSTLVAMTPARRILGEPSLGGSLGVAATALYVGFIVLPVAALLVRAAQQESFLSSLTSDLALTALRLSLLTSVVSMAVVLAVGTPFAYLLARSKSPFLKMVDSLVELPIVLPPVVAGVAMLMAFGRQGILGPALENVGVTLPFTTAAVVFAQIFVASPFYVRAAKLGFQGVARDYEDVSQTLGVSPWWTFWRLTLPLAMPSLLTGLALAWARALSEFGATIMFAGNLTGKTQTMPLAIMTAMESSLDTALALSVMLMAGAVTVLLGLGFIVRRQSLGRP